MAARNEQPVQFVESSQNLREVASLAISKLANVINSWEPSMYNDDDYATSSSARHVFYSLDRSAGLILTPIENIKTLVFDDKWSWLMQKEICAFINGPIDDLDTALKICHPRRYGSFMVRELGRTICSLGYSLCNLLCEFTHDGSGCDDEDEVWAEMQLDRLERFTKIRERVIWGCKKIMDLRVLGAVYFLLEISEKHLDYFNHDIESLEDLIDGGPEMDGIFIEYDSDSDSDSEDF
ncbi:MAG: hypothetical protein M1834_001645 [Cirrosporium novae-zelandiae]|nr:MAG: hypothetical protein M1834_004162 [Cirrosporium novae-zelandiae]KAI9735629.1 MAG: hypothetical protein M1834_001645 [Cirrosporium novae-zelandiae]